MIQAKIFLRISEFSSFKCVLFCLTAEIQTILERLTTKLGEVFFTIIFKAIWAVGNRDVCNII